MSKWRKLDLTSSWDRPAVGQLAALRLVPNNGRASLYSREKYDIGEFRRDPQTGRKLWWHGTRGCEDPVRLRKHYEIWWCPVHEFDGIEM